MVLNAGFLLGAWRIWRRDEAVAEADGYAVEKKFFRFSLYYLFLHFGAFLVEAALRAVPASGAGRWRSDRRTRSTSAALAAILGVGLMLVAFVAIVFGLTVVKVRAVGPIEGYDHVVQPHLVPAEATQ